MSKTLHARLSEMPRRKPVNKQAAMALHSPQPEFVSELDPNDTHIESDTFIQPYPFADWVNLHHPRERHKWQEHTDHSGATFGKVKVLGVYLPEYDHSTPYSRMYEQYYNLKEWHNCPTCGHRTHKREQTKRVKTIPKLQWVCRCNCGNYRVITSKEAYRQDETMSCSACDAVRILREKQ